MNKIKDSSPEARIPSYYRYFCKLKRLGASKVTSDEMRKEFGFKSISSITRDLSLLIENPGRKKYGYNLTFLCNQFKKFMYLDSVCNIAIIGNEDNINLEEIKDMGLNILEILPTPDTDKLIDCNMVILTEHFESDLSDFIPDNVSIVIDLCNNKLENYKGKIERIDIIEMLLKAWYLYNKEHE